jgi:hypothetical protein
MGLKEDIVKGVEDVKDSVSETAHRANANAEQAKRDVAGDQMTTSEKVGSALNQAKESVQAEYDKTKRNVRDTT